MSFLGAAIGSSSVFGPCFWIALGAFLIYRGKEKEKENQDKREAVIPDEHIVQPVTDGTMQDDAIAKKNRLSIDMFMITQRQGKL